MYRICCVFGHLQLSMAIFWNLKMRILVNEKVDLMLEWADCVWLVQEMMMERSIRHQVYRGYGGWMGYMVDGMMHKGAIGNIGGCLWIWWCWTCIGWVWCCDRV